MNNGRPGVRSSTSDRHGISHPTDNPLRLRAQRCSSQIITPQHRPLFCKFLYSKGKLVHSKLVISRPLRKTSAASLPKENTFSDNQILELQDFFRNKKIFDFSTTTSSETRDHNLPKRRFGKSPFVKRTAHRLKKAPPPEPRYLSMQSSRAHKVFKVFEDTAEVFDVRSVEYTNEGYFNTDNDIDTDEEQQKKAIEINLNSVALGHHNFVREFQREREKSEEVSVRLRPTGRKGSQNN